MLSYLTALLSLTACAVLGSSLHEPTKRSDEPFIRTLYEYPVGIWLENIAVRPSGELLLTIANIPHLDQLNPFQANSTPSTVHSFEDDAHVTSVFGIAEVAHDSFAVIVGNFSLEDGTTPGSWGIWGVDFGGQNSACQAAGATAAAVHKIADIPEANFLNGLCSIPSGSTPRDLLAGDIKQGVIYHVNTQTGAPEVAINNSLTAPGTDPVFGSSAVNGIHVAEPQNEDESPLLYFANTGLGLFARMPIETQPGASTVATAADEHAARVVTRIQNGTQEFDDFALSGDDAFLVTGSGNSVERVALNDGTARGSVAMFVAGSLNSTLLAEPTSCAFGRTDADRHILYVVTAGGLAAPVDGSITVGAQVVAIDTSRWEEDSS